MPIDVECPILVVGGGMGALAAAIEAAKYTDGVALACKAVAGRSGSSIVAGGFTFPPEDNSKLEAHLKNTLECSLGLSDYPLARALASDAVSSARFLEDLGIRFTMIDGKYARRRGMGYDSEMLVLMDFTAGDHCGRLRREALARRVNFFDGVRVTKVLVRDGEVCGALAETADGEEIRFRTRSVILAAGGATALYPFSSASSTTTGDGLVLALQAGAVLVDMEFSEFTLVPMVEGRPLAVGGAGAMARNTRYLNDAGERILEKYDPVRLEKTVRSTIVRAVYEETQAGHTVWCVGDKGSLAEGATPGNPVIWRKMQKARLNPFVKPFQWAVSIHRLLGGARINEHGESNVPGLFCVGENAGGVHGAARLPGHAMLETVVFGRRAAHLAAVRSRPPMGGRTRAPELPGKGMTEAADGACRSGFAVPRVTKVFPEQGNRHGERAVQRVQEIMFKGGGVVRDAHGLSAAIEELRGLMQEFQNDKTGLSHGGHDFLNLATVGMIVCRAALERRETRGTHVRTDYPDAQPDVPPVHWGAVSDGGPGSVRVYSVPVNRQSAQGGGI